MYTKMISKILVLFIQLIIVSQVKAQNNNCKKPAVEQRALADDVRFASPFYVIALPRTAFTEQIDNVCYTYYESGSAMFNHVMSVTFKDGTNKFHSFTKGDIFNRMGVAEAKAQGTSSCTFHDYTLAPVCNVTVFILYRCFLDGSCKDIDIGPSSGVDARITLAANPTVSKECVTEIEASLKDTSQLDGGNYVILPQKLKPQCITRFNNTDSIGKDRAVGSKEVTSGNFGNRLGDGGIESVIKTTTSKPFQAQKPMQSSWQQTNNPPKNQVLNQAGQKRPSFNPYGITVSSGSSSQGSYAASFSSTQTGSNQQQGYSPAAAQASWTQNNAHWSSGPNPWNGQNVGGENHYHTWSSNKPANNGWNNNNNNDNVFYHVHKWDNPPPGCCKCQ